MVVKSTTPTLIHYTYQHSTEHAIMAYYHPFIHFF